MTDRHTAVLPTRSHVLSPSVFAAGLLMAGVGAQEGARDDAATSTSMQAAPYRSCEGLFGAPVHLRESRSRAATILDVLVDVHDETLLHALVHPERRTADDDLLLVPFDELQWDTTASRYRLPWSSDRLRQCREIDRAELRRWETGGSLTRGEPGTRLCLLSGLQRAPVVARDGRFGSSLDAVFDSRTNRIAYHIVDRDAANREPLLLSGQVTGVVPHRGSHVFVSRYEKESLADAPAYDDPATGIVTRSDIRAAREHARELTTDEPVDWPSPDLHATDEFPDLLESSGDEVEVPKPEDLRRTPFTTSYDVYLRSLTAPPKPAGTHWIGAPIFDDVRPVLTVGMGTSGADKLRTHMRLGVGLDWHDDDRVRWQGLIEHYRGPHESGYQAAEDLRYIGIAVKVVF